MSVAGFVTIAAVTPGPNNLIVLRAASRAGVGGALPAIAGVVLGGLAVLAIALVASDAAFAAEPRLRVAAGGAGCLYLMWLGLSLVRHAGRPSSGPARGLPAPSVAGLVTFQLLNPKAWVMVMTAIGAMPTGAQPWWSLGVVFTVIPASCLLLWAIAGVALARWLAQPRIAAWVDCAMGVLLIATAIALVELP